MFNLKEWKIIREALECKTCDVAFLRYCGGDVGHAAYMLLDDLITICDRIDALICEADVEANSQDATAALPKRTACNLDQRSAGDEVSLDQHIQLYREVF